MNKLKLLKKIHKIVWRNEDLMHQEDLWDLQEIIDREVIREARKGNLKIKQLSNGYIKSIKII